MDARLVNTRPLNILIVDDEAMLRMAIRLTLEDHGHRVVEAPDADEGYRLARSQPFDVAVLDVNMPGDGLRLLDRLQGDGILTDRVLMLTADLSRRHIVDRLVSAGTPVLGKPFDFGELVRIIEGIATAEAAVQGSVEREAG